MADNLTFCEFPKIANEQKGEARKYQEKKCWYYG